MPDGPDLEVAIQAHQDLMLLFELAIASGGELGADLDRSGLAPKGPQALQRTGQITRTQHLGGRLWNKAESEMAASLLAIVAAELPKGNHYRSGLVRQAREKMAKAAKQFPGSAGKSYRPGIPGQLHENFRTRVGAFPPAGPEVRREVYALLSDLRAAAQSRQEIGYIRLSTPREQAQRDAAALAGQFFAGRGVYAGAPGPHSSAMWEITRDMPNGAQTSSTQSPIAVVGFEPLAEVMPAPPLPAPAPARRPRSSATVVREAVAGTRHIVPPGAWQAMRPGSDFRR